jgi:two-component system, sensor histidine kinase PdtaS
VSPTTEARDDRTHLQRLIATWGVVADFCFGDLVLLVPSEPEVEGAAPTAFRVLGQVRPTTSQTLYLDDLVDRVVQVAERPLLGDCWTRGEILEGQNFTISGRGSARVEYIPVRRPTATGPRLIAVLTRELALDARRRPGRLERVYVEVFDCIARMIAAGLFPYPAELDPDSTTDPPRVGDGVITLDRSHTITFASPNAISALHRLGTFTNAEGRAIGSLGAGLGVVDACLTTGIPVSTEIERVAASGNGRVIVALHAMPLQRPTDSVDSVPVNEGAVVLLRDVSDLRRRDRLLVTKDATIREVHHRVKNNLQTISSLLRLQGRRTTSVEAREAIEESARRIRVIALVHETLSRDVRDAVPFDDIVRPLVRLVEESLVSPERPIRIYVDGTIGDLPPETATPLAVVLMELVQNAVEHGYPGTVADAEGIVMVRLSRGARELTVEVRDDGVGFPDGFSLATSNSLGLSIVRTLITTELGGAIALRNEGGAVAELRVPRPL